MNASTTNGIALPTSQGPVTTTKALAIFVTAPRTFLQTKDEDSTPSNSRESSVRGGNLMEKKKSIVKLGIKKKKDESSAAVVNAEATSSASTSTAVSGNLLPRNTTSNPSNEQKEASEKALTEKLQSALKRNPGMHRRMRSQDAFGGASVASLFGPLNKSETSTIDTAEPPHPLKRSNSLPDVTRVDNDNTDNKPKLLQTTSTNDDEVSPEEASTVLKSHDESTTSIHVEKLLRITFTKLGDEGYLLNLPVISEAHLMDKKDWIQLYVMVRANSMNLILERLDRTGVGSLFGTVTVFDTEFCRTASPAACKAEDADAPADTPAKSIRERADSINLLEDARQEWKLAATRLRIEQVREQILEQAEFSFDFLSLLVVASILSGVGLVTNNTVVIVASMLVSPIMGPVLGLTFGTRIQDWPLVLRSLHNECLALVGCVLVGLLIGLGAGFTTMAQEDWPTNEMEIRGEPVGLLTGIAIAIPSGMGVCLSILGGNTSSLVGVAISASLLPPAVNTGICFMYSLILRASGRENDNDKSAGDFAVIAAISFVLTVLNIVCIWLSGILMFEVKEVAPVVEKSAFWTRDLKVARDLNRGEQKPIDFQKLRDGLKATSTWNNPTGFGSSPLVRRHSAMTGSYTINDALSLKTHTPRPTVFSLFDIPEGNGPPPPQPLVHNESVGYEGLEALFSDMIEDESDNVPQRRYI